MQKYCTIKFREIPEGLGKEKKKIRKIKNLASMWKSRPVGSNIVSSRAHRRSTNITWWVWHFSLFCENTNAICSKEKSSNFASRGHLETILSRWLWSHIYLFILGGGGIKKMHHFYTNLWHLCISTSRIMHGRSLKTLESMYVLVSGNSKGDFGTNPNT